MWPRWSHRYLVKGKRKWHALHATEHHDRTDVKIVRHAGDPHDWQVKCVDEKCNNGWMRKLENTARPILIPLLRGDETRIYLGKKEQTVLAAWIALKTMIQEYAPRGNVISHHTQLRQLWRKQLAPRSTWRIWIARYVEPNVKQLWISHPMLLVPDSVAKRRKDDTATYYNSQAMTYVIGKLFIHLIRSPHKSFIRRWRFDPSVALKLAPIWPLTGYDVVWPLESLTDLEATYVASVVREFVKSSRQPRL